MGKYRVYAECTISLSTRVALEEIASYRNADESDPFEMAHLAQSKLDSIDAWDSLAFLEQRKRKKSTRG